MTKYIKCDEDFIDRAMRACGPCTTAVIGITELLEQESAADVVEVKHGEWITPTRIKRMTIAVPHCSLCGNVPCDKGFYCPWCGAKMDLKEGITNDN